MSRVGYREREVSFGHTVRAWTVGQLRRALDGVPDDTPIRVNVAETPGGDTVDEQVVIDAGFGQHRMAEDPPGTWRTDTQFGLDCEFPPGTYDTTVTDDYDDYDGDG